MVPPGSLLLDCNHGAHLGDLLHEDALDAAPQRDGRHGAAVAGAEQTDRHDPVLDPDQLDVAAVELDQRTDPLEGATNGSFHASSLLGLSGAPTVPHNGFVRPLPSWLPVPATLRGRILAGTGVVLLVALLGVAVWVNVNPRATIVAGKVPLRPDVHSQFPIEVTPLEDQSRHGLRA